MGADVQPGSGGALAAVSHALNRAGFAMLAGGLQLCLTTPQTDHERAGAVAQLEKLFLSLA